MPNDLSLTISSNLTAASYQDVALNLSAVPLQNITLTVTPSSNFYANGYLYQWKAAGNDITGAVSPVYTFDAAESVGNTTFTCVVSGLTGTNAFVYRETTPSIVISVNADTSIFARHTPRGANPLKESGYERFKRIRNMGYC
jgi:hypothetical protein